MPDWFSELKRIKSQLKGPETEAASRPPRSQVARVPELRRGGTPLKLPNTDGMSRLNGQSKPLPPNDKGHGTGTGQLHRSAQSTGGKDISSKPFPRSSRGAASPPVSSPVKQLSIQVQPVVPAKRSLKAPLSKPQQPAQSSIKRPQPVPSVFRPLPKGAPTRQDLFRQPEGWIARGGWTQCVEAGHSGAVDIVIGLDFGTSYTKAAVGFRDKIFPVTWDGVSKCEPNYLLPSEYTELRDGSLFIGQHPNARSDEIRNDLKLPFINPAVSRSSIGAASTFIALVLRYVRAWVFHHHGDKLGRAHLRWQLNIGAPSNGLESTQLARAYHALAATGWRRSLETNPQRLAGSASELWQEGEALPDLVDHQVRPEFVAQMAGYMQSPKRQRGLHALVDVGGGTLDVVTFNVHQVDEEDTFPFLVPQVHALGTHGLIQNRLLGVEADGLTRAVDELAPIDAAPVFARATGVAEAHVVSRDALFRAELQRVIKSVFDITKSRRYRLSDAWRTGIRTFFTGGGALFDLYREALKTMPVPSTQGLHLMPLPPHKNLDGFTGGVHEYQRISVACGLAQDAFTLGRIVPAKEVEDDRPVVPTYRSSRPDRDDLYPK